MSFGGNGGGSSSIATGSDVVLSSPVSNQVLTYDGAVAKWKNSSLLNSRFNMRGDFAVGVGYVLNDVVNSSGYGLFYCIQAHTSANPAPTKASAYWKPLGGVVIGTTAGTAADASTVGIPTVAYNHAGATWPARPSTSGPVLWASPQDAAAAQPSDMAVWDMWIRNPDA